VKFLWGGEKWHKQNSLSRRNFLIGASAVVAAPLVVRSGILMPVRKLIVPEQRILVPYAVLKLEASYDQKEWFLVTRAVHPHGSLLSPANFPVKHDSPYSRVVIEREWKPGHSLLPGTVNDSLRNITERGFGPQLVRLLRYKTT